MLLTHNLECLWVMRNIVAMLISKQNLHIHLFSTTHSFSCIKSHHNTFGGFFTCSLFASSSFKAILSAYLNFRSCTYNVVWKARGR